MDPLGKTVRDFLSRLHSDEVHTATNLAMELKKEGMNRGEIEEMLYASGYESEVVNDALENLPTKSKK